MVNNKNKIKPKPNPEPYNYAMAKLKVKKKNTLIFEDSPVGLLSAKRTGAHYIKVNKPKQMSYKYLKKIMANMKIFDFKKWLVVGLLEILNLQLIKQKIWSFIKNS